MVTIDLHKPSKRKAFFRQISFPSEWNELQLPELLAISKELINPDTADPATGRVNIFMFLLRHRVKLSGIRMDKGWEALLNIDHVSTQGLDAIKWIFAENTLTKLPEKQIAFGHLTGIKTMGPADDFNTLTCGEYEDAGVFTQLFAKDPQIDHLVMIAAILYRQPGKPYKNYKAESMKKYFQKLSPERLYLVLVWFTGCSSMLPKFFPDVFEKGGSGDDITAFTKCIHAGAGPKNGTRENIRQMNLKEFMFDMQQEAVKAKEELAAYEAAARH